MQEKAFTLLEITMVVVIIGILAAVALPNYFGMREQALDKEAIANILLIMSAEKIYRMEDNTHRWYMSSDIRQLNDNLKLSLPAGNNRNWEYTARDLAGNVGTLCVQARRNGADNRFWRIVYGDPLPPPAGLSCGPPQ